jgi:hypothetical protein
MALRHVGCHHGPLILFFISITLKMITWTPIGRVTSALKQLMSGQLDAMMFWVTLGTDG